MQRLGRGLRRPPLPARRARVPRSARRRADAPQGWSVDLSARFARDHDDGSRIVLRGAGPSDAAMVHGTGAHAVARWRSRSLLRPRVIRHRHDAPNREALALRGRAPSRTTRSRSSRSAARELADPFAASTRSFFAAEIVSPRSRGDAAVTPSGSSRASTASFGTAASKSTPQPTTTVARSRISAASDSSRSARASPSSSCTACSRPDKCCGQAGTLRPRHRPSGPGGGKSNARARASRRSEDLFQDLFAGEAGARPTSRHAQADDAAGQRANLRDNFPALQTHKPLDARN